MGMELEDDSAESLLHWSVRQDLHSPSVRWPWAQGKGSWVASLGVFSLADLLGNNSHTKYPPCSMYNVASSVPLHSCAPRKTVNEGRSHPSREAHPHPPQLPGPGSPDFPLSLWLCLFWTVLVSGSYNTWPLVTGYFTEHRASKVHPCWSMNQVSHPFWWPHTP